MNPLITTTDAATLQDVRGSISRNTARAYAGHVKRLDAWLQDLPLTDTSLRDYAHWLESQGKAPATIAQAIAAAAFRARVNGTPSPAGELTQRALKRIKRECAIRGRGQSAAVTANDVARIMDKARPRDAALAAVLFHAGLRRSEASQLEWRDLAPASIPGALLLKVRRSKTNQDGARADVRLIKGQCAAAIKAIQPKAPNPQGKVLGMSARTISRRFAAAAKAAGVQGRVTAHSGRIGLATELTRRGAPTAATMLAGGWKTARMVAHYAAAMRAEHGAVARYL